MIAFDVPVRIDSKQRNSSIVSKLDHERTIVVDDRIELPIITLLPLMVMLLYRCI